MEPLPRFELFPDPLRENVFEPSEHSCNVCGRSRGYLYCMAPGASEAGNDNLRVCPWCIADGSAQKRGLHFNDATQYPHHDDTPQMNESDRALVEHRTPGFFTWQGNHWLMCCGRACVYLGEARDDDLRGRWAEAAASKTMWDGLEWTDQQKLDLVASITGERSPHAYVFQCRECGRLKAYWDCD